MGEGEEARSCGLLFCVWNGGHPRHPKTLRPLVLSSKGRAMNDRDSEGVRGLSAEHDVVCRARAGRNCAEEQVVCMA